MLTAAIRMITTVMMTSMAKIEAAA